MGTQAFYPEIWDAQIQRDLRKNLVAKQVCKIYSDKIKEYGDTIHFPGLAPVTIGTYTEKSTLTYENLASSEISLIANQRNKYSFHVGKLESLMANADIKSDSASDAAYQLADACDKYIFGSNTYNEISAGNTVTDATTDTATILGDISKAGRILEENNVKPRDMWIILPPWVKEKLRLAGVKWQINDGMEGTGGVSWAEYCDMKLYISNNLTNLGSVAAPQHICLAGSNTSIAFAEKLLANETLQDKDDFGWYLRGLHVFGVKVLKPKELVKLDLTYAAESAI